MKLSIIMIILAEFFLKITKWECKTGRSWEDFLFLRERDCVIFQRQSYYTLFPIFSYLSFFVVSFLSNSFELVFFLLAVIQLIMKIIPYESSILGQLRDTISSP